MKNFQAWCDKQSDRLGRMTLILSMLMALVGFPSQIWKNYIDQKCGMILILIVVPLAIFLVRIPYGVSKRAWHLIPADITGLIASVLLLVQYFYYG